MDLGRLEQAAGTEMPNPSLPVLETVVRSHSTQLRRFNSELTSAFSLVTGEMGELKASTASTSATLTSLATQVSVMTDLLTRLLQSPAPKPNLGPPRDLLASPAPVTPKGEPLDPRWEPSLPLPECYSGDFGKCRGFLEECHNFVRCQPSRFHSDGAKVAFIVSSLSDWSLYWAMAAFDGNPQLSSDLAAFSVEFRRAFDHPSNGADAAGRLHSFPQGPRGIPEHTLEFRTLFLVRDEELRERCSERAQRSRNSARGSASCGPSSPLRCP